MAWVEVHYNYLLVIILLMTGLWAMIGKNNLIKKCIGMCIFQNAIIMFYISMGAKKGATIPILKHVPGAHGHGPESYISDPTIYANPLTQILMLTAIVVGVATLGMALTLVQKIYREYGTCEEDEILNCMSEEQDHELPLQDELKA
jgi:multicomponent Na+:H+ antiporter subunit C